MNPRAPRRGVAWLASAVAFAALAALVFSCAKREPPSGGPPDLQSPRRIASGPDSGTAGVPVTSALSITFSEPMEPRSTAEAVSIAPRIDIAKRLWSGRTLTLVPAKPLEPNRTYTLFVGGTARDRHGNAMSSGSTVVFSTSDSFPRGRIAGRIEPRGVTASGVALWCYRGAREPDSTARDFDALGLADAEGNVRIDGLAVPERYRIWAFVDQNGNRSFEPASDVLAAIDTTFELTREHPVADSLRFLVINPRAPGTARGTVLDSLPDSLGVLRVLAVSGRDSTVKVLDDVDDESNFEVRLDPGTWTIRAFRDLDRSRTWQPDREPASEPKTLVIEPAGETEVLKLRILNRGRR